MLKGFIIAGLDKASQAAKKGQDYFEKDLNERHARVPTPAPSGSSQGRTVTAVPQTTSAPKVASAPKTFPPKASDCTPSISQTRTADPLPKHRAPASSAVTKLTSQFESNSSAPSRPSPSSPPAPNITPSAKKETSYTPQVTQSTPPSGTRTFGAPPTRPSAPIQTSTPLPKKITTVHPQVFTSNALSGGSGRSFGKPLPRPTAPNETNAPVVAPNTSLYSFGTKPLPPRPTAPIETNAPHSSPVPKKISPLYSPVVASDTPLYSFGAKPLHPPSAPQSQSSIMTPPQPSQFGVTLRSPTTPAPYVPSPIPGPSHVHSTPLRVEHGPAANAEAIWEVIDKDRSRIISLDIKPVCDASGNIILRGHQYDNSPVVTWRMDLTWKLKYRDPSGAQKEKQFLSFLENGGCLPSSVRDVSAKYVFWGAYLTLHSYIQTAQGCLNPAKKNPSMWDAAERFVSYGIKSHNLICSGTSNFTLNLGCNPHTSEFTLEVKNAQQPGFAIINDVVPRPVAPTVLNLSPPPTQSLKAKPISWTLSSEEVAALEAHPFYPLNGTRILEAKYTSSGQRNHLAEVEAILEFLKSFAKGEQAWWSVQSLSNSIQKWKISGAPLPLNDRGTIDLNLSYFHLDHFPEEQRKIIDSFLSIKEAELKCILLQSSQGVNMPKYLRKWAEKGGELSALIQWIRDGQIDGFIDNRAMALLQRQIPELKTYMSIFNSSLDSTVSQHYNNDLQKYHPALFKQEMKAYKASQAAYTPSKTVYRSEMMSSNDPRYGSAVRTATRQQHVAETISSGYSGGATSLTSSNELRHYGWVLADDGTRQYPKGNSASGDCAVM